MEAVCPERLTKLCTLAGLDTAKTMTHTHTPYSVTHSGRPDLSLLETLKGG